MSTLAQPWLLLLLLLIPPVAWAARRARRRAVLPFPSLALTERTASTLRSRLRWVPPVLRSGALLLLVVALARPQLIRGWSSISTEGVAIQIVLDRSGSMREPITDDTGRETTKMAVARGAVRAFVLGDGAGLRGRPSDLVGLIAFSRYADTLAPLSRSHAALADAAARVEPVSVRSEDGTAIGDALALAAARLKRAEEELVARATRTKGTPEFQIKSRVIVLMTDGINNAGESSPIETAKLAKEWGIRIYAIGIGAGERFVEFAGQRVPMGAEIDERMLGDVASMTGGRFFAAPNAAGLNEAYRAIDELEKSRMDSVQHSQRDERFAVFAAAALACVGLELLLSWTLLRRVA